MTKITNSQNLQQQSVSSYSDKKIKNKGFLRGQYAGSIAATPLTLLSSVAVSQMRKTSEISKKDSIDLSIATQKALKKSGLADKGVKVFKVKEVDFLGDLKKLYSTFAKMIKGEDIDIDLDQLENLTSLIKIRKEDIKPASAFAEELKNNKLLKSLMNSKAFKNEDIKPDEFLLPIANKQLLQFKMGMNACFLPKANKVLIPDKHLQTSVFHELGHALNANGNVLLKALQKCRPLAKLVPVMVLITSLLNKRPKNSQKLENDTTKNKIQNVKDGIKNNAGLITGLSMAPMLLEEGLASLRGQNLAKSLVKEGALSKELFKKIKLTNLGGFTSYATAILAAIITCEVAIKVKDKIQQKYEEKRALKIAKALQAHQG